MVAADETALLLHPRQHVVARRPGHVGVHVELDLPVRMADEESRVMSDIGEIGEAFGSRADAERRLARRVAEAGNGRETLDRVAGGEEDEAVLRIVLQHAAHGLETALRRLGCRLHLLLAHPVVVFRLRHIDLGVRIDERAVLAAQPVDVVAVEVAHQHRIHRAGLKPGSPHVLVQQPRALRPVVRETGIHQNASAARFHHEGCVGHHDMVRRQPLALERRLHIAEVRIAHEAGVKRPAHHAVAESEDGQVADACLEGTARPLRSAVRRPCRQRHECPDHCHSDTCSHEFPT